MKLQKGFSLIELMIAGLIGTFLLLGLMNLFITTNKSVVLSDSLSQNQETGRFAMDYITRFARNAGFRDVSSSDSFPELYVLSTAPEPDITCTGNQADACAANDLPTIRGDRLSIAFLSSATTVMSTCSGTLVGGAGINELIVNVFWVNLDPGDPADRELRCRAFNHSTGLWIDQAPVPLVRNVETLQFQVGIADPDPARKQFFKNTARYVSIDQLTDPTLIRSIKVAVLTTSADPDNANAVRSNIENRRYTVLDAPLIQVNDSSVRHIFSTTVELPNAIAGAALEQ